MSLVSQKLKKTALSSVLPKYNMSVKRWLLIKQFTDMTEASPSFINSSPHLTFGIPFESKVALMVAIYNTTVSKTPSRVCS